MSNIRLSVVIPAFNEASNLGAGTLDQVDNYLKKQDYPYEVLIVDDGSTDDTVSIVEKIIKDKKGFKLIKNLHGGKALTVISGILKTIGEIAVFTDMDQATPLDQIEKLFPKFEAGFDIVIGSRGGREGAPLIRKITAWAFSLIRNIILGLPFKDTQCGFKAFNQKAIRAVFPQMEKIWQTARSSGATVNAGFDVEALFLAKKMGLKIAEVPVVWHYVQSERVHVIKDALETIGDLIRVRQKDLLGDYANNSQATLG